MLAEYTAKVAFAVPNFGAKLGYAEGALAVFSEIPLDRAISMDALCSLGYTVGDVMSALTLLEVKGLVMSLPGSLYVRK